MNKKLYISMMLLMVPVSVFSMAPFGGQAQSVRVGFAIRAFCAARIEVRDAQAAGNPERLQIAQQRFSQSRFSLLAADPGNIILQGDQVLKRSAERYGPDTWNRI